MRTCFTSAVRLWRDQSGSVNSAELMLIMTLLCIGMLVGIKSLRDSTITEFADMGQALSNLDQSYSIASFTVTLPDDSELTTASSVFIDEPDFCDQAGDGDAGFSGSACVNVCAPASSTPNEGEDGTLP